MTPTLAAERVRDIAHGFGMNLSPTEVDDYLRVMQATVDAYDVVDAMADCLPEVTYPRTPGHRPEGAANPYNAWYYKTEIKGAPEGKLAGKTLAIKDNVCEPPPFGWSIDYDSLDQGTTAKACRRIALSEQTYYRWRKAYGGPKTDQARRMKDLEKENLGLRRAVFDLRLDKLILQEAAKGNF